MPAAALAAALLLGLGSSQTTPQTSTPLPDIEVTGRPTAEAVRDFVGRVAAPARGRGLAQWRNRVCPGVANLSRDASQAIVDRITEVADDLGIETGEPGCDPNLVVIFTDDGRGLAQAMVEQNEGVFHRNVSGLDRGEGPLRDFQTADRPVRWWSLSVPIDSDTGQRAVRVPGDFAGNIDSKTAQAAGCSEDCPLSYAPIIEVRGASRLRTQIVDVMYKTIIIVDVDQIGQRTTAELGDYLAFVGLAQIAPEADTAGFDTVLNLFVGGSGGGLTEWDRSYLQALYAPSYQRVSAGAQATSVANIMTRERRASASRE